MPPRKKKTSHWFRLFLFVIIFTTLIGVGYLVLLWFQSRETNYVVYPEFGIHIPEGYEIHGIDVSRYQDRISWEAVSSMEVRGIKLGFAFIKATEGTNRVDPFFKRNWKRSKDAGVIRGAYHFFIPSRDGNAQAQNFVKQVKLSSGDLPPVLDVEQTSGLSSEAIRKEVKKCLAVWEEYYAVKPIIYTNAEFYKKHLSGHFDDYPFWVAHYLQPHQPRVSRDWSFWQHSETGRVNGISAKVDFNVFNGDSLDFRSLLVP